MPLATVFRPWRRLLILAATLALAFWTQAQLALAGQRWHRERLHQFVGSPFPSAGELQAMDWGTPLLLALLPWVVALLGLAVRRWRRRRAA